MAGAGLASAAAGHLVVGGLLLLVPASSRKLLGERVQCPLLLVGLSVVRPWPPMWVAVLAPLLPVVLWLLWAVSAALRVVVLGLLLGERPSRAPNRPGLGLWVVQGPDPGAVLRSS